MIEYLFDAIRASSGQDIRIVAEITDDNGIVLTEGCSINLFSPEKEYIASFEGEYQAETNDWLFTIPAEGTQGFKGRYYYCISYHGQSLCFRQPLYLV